MDENANSGSKKRTRGPTTCKKLKETTSNKVVDKTVELDAFGKPHGKWQDNFTSYVGAVFQQRVDINIESWKVVSQGLKDTIWQDIKGEWNIKDDEHKKRIMKRGAKVWKDFKSRRVDDLFKGKNPCEKYDFIKKEQWEKFRITHEKPEFMEIRKKTQERQRCNEHVHYLGKGGYDGNMIKWLKEDPISHFSISESVDPSI